MAANRKLWWLGGVLLCGALAGGVAWWGWGQAHTQARRVAEQRLEELSGGTAQVASATVRQDGIELHDVALFEPDASQPWLTVRRMWLEVPATRALSAERFDSITLDGLHVELRFDESGKLLNSLPDAPAGDLPAPRIEIREGTVVIRQQGKPPLSFADADLRLSEEGPVVQWSGTASGLGSDWKVDGTLEPAKDEFQLSLRTDRLQISDSRIAGLPGVPADRLSMLEFSGVTPVTLVAQRTAGQEWQLNIELRPELTRVAVPGQSQELTNVSGEVSISKQQLTFRTGETDFAGGTLQATGDVFLDRAKRPATLNLTIAGVDIESLDIPDPALRPLSGQISAEGTLVLERNDQSLLQWRTKADWKLQNAVYDQLELASAEGNMVIAAADFAIETGSEREQTSGLGQPLQGNLTGRVRILDQQFNEVIPAVERLVGSPNTTAKRGGNSEFWMNRLGSTPVSGEVVFDAQFGEVKEAKGAKQTQRVRSGSPIGGNQVHHVTWEADLQAARIPLSEGLALNDATAHLESPTASELQPFRLNATVKTDAVETGGALLVQGTLSPDGSAQATINATDISAKLVHSLAAVGDVKLEQITDVQGTLDATADVRVAEADWETPSRWEISGGLSSDRLTWKTSAGELEVVSALQTKLDWQSKKLVWTDAMFRWRELPWTTSGQVRLAEELPYAFAFSVAEEPLARWDESLIDLPGVRDAAVVLGLQGDVEGSLATFTWNAEGTGRLAGKKPIPVGDTDLEITQLPFHWRADPESVSAQSDDIAAWGGTLQIEVSQPLSGSPYASTQNEDGSLRGPELTPADEPLPSEPLELGPEVRVNLQDVEVSKLLAVFAPDLPVRITGPVRGSVRVAPEQDWREAEVVLQGEALQIRWNEMDIRRIEADLAYRDGRLSYRMWGDLLDGDLAWRGSTASLTKDSADWTFPGQVTLRHVSLRQLLQQWDAPASSDSQQEFWSSLSGRLRGSGNVVLAAQASRQSASGQLEVRNVSWRRGRLDAPLSVQLALADDAIRIDRFRTQWGRAIVDGRMQWPLTPNRSGTFAINVSHLPLTTALEPWPEWQREVGGRVTARVQGRIPPNLISMARGSRPIGNVQWQGTSQIDLHEARMGGLTFSVPRAQIDWVFDPNRQTYRLQMRRTTLQLAHGQLQGSGRLEKRSGGYDVDLEGRVSRIRVGELLKGYSQARYGASGELGGRFELSGRGMRSLDDLDGKFEGDLQQAQAFQLPVIQDLGRFLNVGAVARSPVENSRLVAHLRRSVLHIDEMTIAADAAQLFIEGEATLAGRLDLDVTAHTGRWINQPTLTRVLRSSILLTQPLPAGLLFQANQFLEDRLVFLHVGGTLRSPVIQLRAAPQLRQETARFFLQQAVQSLLPVGPATTP